MILALLLLLCFQLLGEVTVFLTKAVIPGPVLGMAFFFIALVIHPPLKDRVEPLSRFMNTHLALFFVPAGVGMMEYFDLFGRYGWVMGLTLLISTTITLAVTAWCFNFLIRSDNKGEHS